MTLQPVPHRPAAIVLAAVLMLGSVTGVAPQSLDGEPDQSGDLQRGPWIPSYQFEFGGFDQLNGYAALSEGGGWGIDVNQGSLGYESLMVKHEDHVFTVRQVLFGAYLNALDIAEDGTGFAVGRDGAIFRLFDGQWSRFPSPTRRDLSAIDLWSAQAGWAVGDFGTILRWTGSGWTVEHVPVLGNVVAVAATSATSGWAANRDGTLFSYSEGAWRARGDAPYPGTIQDMAFESDSWGIVAADTVMEWRNGAWRLASELGEGGEQVAFGGGRAYLVTREGDLMSSDGAGWARVVRGPDVGNDYVHGVAGGGDHAIVYSRLGMVARLDGNVAHRLWPLMERVLDVAGRTTGPLWTAGLASQPGMYALVGRQDGQWTARQLEGGDIGINAVVLEAGEGWAVGSALAPVRGRVFGAGGGTWQRYPFDEGVVLTNLDRIGPDDVWAGGINGVARWNGDSWKLVDGAPHTQVSGPVAMLTGGSSPRGWFGGGDNVWELDGDEWISHAIPVTRTVTALVAHSAADAGTATDLVWAIAGGRLIAYDGEWRIPDAPLPEGEFAVDLDSPDPDNLWVLTNLGRLLHHRRQLHLWNAHDMTRFGSQAVFQRINADRTDELDGWDIWLTGAPSAVARYRVVTPAVRTFLPLNRLD